MTSSGANTPFVAIACGGTGGHLFPGLAVAEQLQKRGCAVALLISPKDVDQEAVKSARGMEIFTLPAVGLQNRNYFSFAGSSGNRCAPRGKFSSQRPPHAVLAMGGFTSAPPVLGRKGFRRENFPARIQHHSRPRQPFSRAVRGRGVRRFSRSRRATCAPARSRRPARRCVRNFSRAIAAAVPRLRFGLESESPDHSGHGRQSGRERHQRHDFVRAAVARRPRRNLAMAASHRRERCGKSESRPTPRAASRPS